MNRPAFRLVLVVHLFCFFNRKFLAARSKRFCDFLLSSEHIILSINYILRIRRDEKFTENH